MRNETNHSKCTAKRSAAGLQPCENDIRVEGLQPLRYLHDVPQRLKPEYFLGVTAGLKACSTRSPVRILLCLNKPARASSASSISSNCTSTRCWRSTRARRVTASRSSSISAIPPCRCIPTTSACASARPRSSPVRVDLPAPALCLSARLPDRDVCAHTANAESRRAGPCGGRGHRQLTLREYIEREIGERGPIPFSRYMELCLYGAPGGDPPGYYSRVRDPPRPATSTPPATCTPCSARLLARQFDEMWRALKSPARIDLVELGPGRGLFAQDVLDWTAKKFPEFHRALHTTLVEASHGLRARLDERFAAQIAAAKVKVVETIEPAQIEGIIHRLCQRIFRRAAGGGGRGPRRTAHRRGKWPIRRELRAAPGARVTGIP